MELPHQTNPWRNRPNLQVVEGFLGKGYFGKVWRAQHSIDKSEYAIKQISLQKTIQYFEGDVSKLLREVVHLARINFNSEHIVKYHDCWSEGPHSDELVKPSPNLDKLLENPSYTSYSEMEDDTYIFIQMEMCHGTLDTWLKNLDPQKRRFQYKEEIYQILLHLVTALKSIHEQNIIHRDLKPDNIFYKKILPQNKLIWKIGDFGLSISHKTSTENQTTSALSVKGNVRYASPEKNNKFNYDAKSDVFSLGLVFVEILYPFQSTLERNTIFDSIRDNTDWTHVSKLIETRYSPVVAKILKEMLHSDPNVRWNIGQVWKLLSKRDQEQDSSLESSGATASWEQKHNSDLSTEPLLNFCVPSASRKFIGREQELNVLKNLLKTTFPIIVDGPSGIGKTEILKQFVHILQKEVKHNKITDKRVKSYFIWLEAGSPGIFRCSVIHLAKQAGILNQHVPAPRNSEKPTVELLLEIVSKVRDGSIVLILDGVRDSINPVNASSAKKLYMELENLVNSLTKDFYQRQQTGGLNNLLSVIISTTHNYLPAVDKLLKFGKCLHLQELHENDVVNFVKHNINVESNPENSIKLCSLLHCHPLPLQLAHGYIQYQQKINFNFEVAKYLELFAEMENSNTIEYEEDEISIHLGDPVSLSLLITCSLTLGALIRPPIDSEIYLEAVQLLQFLIYLHPRKDITFNFLLFLRLGKEDKRDRNAIMVRSRRATQIQTSLTLLIDCHLITQTYPPPDEYGNVNQKKTTLHVNQYISWAVRTLLGLDEEIETLTQLLNTYVKNDPYFYQFSGFGGEENVHGHYISLCSHATRHDTLISQFPYLFQKFYNVHFEIGLESLEQSGSEIIATLTRVLGASNIYTLNVEFNRAIAKELDLLDLGVESLENVVKVVTLYRKILERQSKRFGDSHELTQRVLFALSKLIFNNYSRDDEIFSLEEAVQLRVRMKNGKKADMGDSDVFHHAMKYSGRSRIIRAMEKGEQIEISSKFSLQHELLEVLAYSRILVENGNSDKARLLLEDVIEPFQNWAEPLPSFLHEEENKTHSGEK